MFETPHGFLTYGFNCVPGLEKQHVYIEDLYVVPEMRKTHIAATMANEVCRIAKERGIYACVGSVNKQTKTHKSSEKVLRAYGMEKFSEDAFTAWFIKGIG